MAIVPGDPDRVERIATAASDSARFLAREREFTSWLTTIGDHPVVVCSTGVGGPSTSVAIEELAQLGITTFLRVGTTGAIQPNIDLGDLIIMHASVRLDGASFHFAPPEYPAVADFHCTQALANAARRLDFAHHIGITASSDTFYPGQERYGTVSGWITERFRGSREEWTRLGVLNYEMETATLFTMCSANGWRAGGVAGVIANRNADEAPIEQVAAEVERRSIATAIEAARELLAQP